MLKHTPLRQQIPLCISTVTENDGCMNTGSRLWEIDCARGIAILMMIVFHTVFDLSFFAMYPVDVAGGFWRYFAYTTASLFLLVVGVSLVVSHARAAATLSGFPLAKKFLLRGAGIFALGLLVTLATWLYLHEGLCGLWHPAPDRCLRCPLAALLPVREMEHCSRARVHSGSVS